MRKKQYLCGGIGIIYFATNLQPTKNSTLMKNKVNRALVAKKKHFLLWALCLMTVFAGKSQAEEVYTSFKESTGTLTYYFDDQRADREAAGEFTEVYDPDATRFIAYHNKVTKCVIDASMKNAGLKSTAYMFFGGWGETDYVLSAMTEIEGISNLVTTNVTDMRGMFDYCSALESLDLRSFNTAKVMNMSNMFYGCSALASLNVSSFITANVTTMSNMFCDCSALVSLNLGSFNTERVTNMSSMFSGCSSLESLDLSSFVTTNVTTMSGMFYGCRKLATLNVSSFSTAKVKSMRYMFLQCPFTTIDVSGFNTAAVTDMKGMFSQCLYLRSVDVSKFSTANVTDMSGMFENCYYLTSLDLRSFNISKVTNMSSMFSNCQRLTTIWCAGNWSSSSALTSSSNMFKACTSLEGDNGTLCDGENNIDKSYARPDEAGAPGYFTPEKTLGDPEVYTAYKDGVLTYYFDNRRSKRSGITEPYDPVKNVATVRFREYHDQITKVKIDASMQDAGLTSTCRMFFGGLAVIDEVDHYYTLTALTEIEGMENLVTDEVTDMSWMFYGCSLLGSLDATHMKTGNVVNFGRMFNGCAKLTELNLNSFDISKASYLYSMFEGCSSLRKIRCNGNWSKSTASASGLFKGCTSLAGDMGTVCDGVNTIDQSYARPDYGEEQPGYFSGSYSKEVYTSYDASTQTLTCYYDNKRSFRAGVNEPYDPVNEPEALRFKAYHDQVKKVKIDVSMLGVNLTSMRSMFYGGAENGNVYRLTNVDSISDIDNLLTDKVTDMREMFKGCTKLGKIDFSEFETPKVTNMNSMFADCSSLNLLNLNLLDISNVTDMRNMFSGCTNLKTILCNNNWSESPALAETENMFYGCTSLVGGKGTAYNIAKLDKEYARPDQGSSENGYFTKQEPEVYTSFNETKGTLTYFYDDQRFYREGINELYDPDASSPFSGYAKKVTKAVIDKSMKDVKLTSMRRMFYGLSAMTEITGFWDLATGEEMDTREMFYDCSSLTAVDFTFFKTSKVKTMYNMFKGCSKLTSLNLRSFDTRNVTDMRQMFVDCQALTSLDISSFNTANVTAMNGMFMFCKSLASIDVSKFNTANVTSMGSMFADCFALTSLDLSSFNTAKVSDVAAMFYHCEALQTIWCNEDWSKNPLLANPGAVDGLFEGCTALVGDKGSKCDGETNIGLAYAHIDGGETKPGYFTEKKVVYSSINRSTGVLTYYYNGFRMEHEAAGESTEVYAPDEMHTHYLVGGDDVKKGVIDASMKEAGLTTTCQMFAYLIELTEIEGMENLVTDEVTSMKDMFDDCAKLASIDVSGFNIAKVTNMSGMFRDCSLLTTILCSENWSRSNVLTSSDEMFNGCVSLVGGSGTKYDASHIDKAYAHLDEGNSNPGYFTLKDLNPLPNNQETTFDFSLYDPAGSEILGVSLGAKDQYNAQDGRIEIATTNTAAEIDAKLNAAFAGAASLKSLLPGTITFELNKGNGKIEIDCQTLPGYTLKVKIAEYGEAYITASVEQSLRGKATVNYSVSQKTYVVIYLEGAPGSSAPGRLARSANEENAGAYIYAIKVMPENAGAGVEQVNSQELGAGSRKLLMDGVLYIEHNGRVYDATGRVVK